MQLKGPWILKPPKKSSLNNLRLAQLERYKFNFAKLASMSVREKDQRYLAQVYRKQPIALVEGKGALVKDSDGKEYIDCVSGLGVLNVGHSHPKVVAAIREQASKMIHSSNLYYVQPQIELAELLSRISGGFKTFFCNSGAEANEAAIKLARIFTGKSEIITAENSFHGRTLATLSATGQEKYKKGFQPLLKEFIHVKYGDIDAIVKTMNEKTAAVLLEPIQGEGGVIVPPEGYLKEVKEICRRNNALFILDEVQTALGRTGRMFAWQLFEAEPDVFTLAKALGGGFPIGAMLAKPEIMEALKYGSHASTFGGNHLACSAAKASIEAIIEEKLAEKAQKLGAFLIARLKGLQRKHPVIKEVRGRGLMIGVELTRECASIVEKAREKGVLLNCVQDKVLRFLPPLVIEEEMLDRAIAVLAQILRAET